MGSLPVQARTGSHDPAPPMALIAELTHRCPLACPYCSNPLALEPAARELDTASWRRVLREAAALGVLQAHFTGGEPLARRDLPELVGEAAGGGIYTNLITSGLGLTANAAASLAVAGLEHVQLSFQDSEPEANDRIGGARGGFRRKLAAAACVRQAGMVLTANFVIHRQNAARVPAMIALGAELGATRIEIAHVQYYGWAMKNRAALLPDAAQLATATEAVEAARARLAGIVIDYVVPDYHAVRPKACMGGWARRTINISPAGRALPCHAAETLPDFDFPSVLARDLGWIWRESDAFRRFRGTGWMPEPCRSCERREIDWGGCRCQAFAITGNPAAADPACALSPDHAAMAAAVAEGVEDALVWRGRIPK